MNLFKSINALLITNPVNIRYLTGFTGVDSRDAYLLLTKNQTFLFVNSLYREQAKQLNNKQILQSANNTIKRIEIVELSREKPFEKELLNVLKSSKRLDLALGIEETNLTVVEFNKLKQKLKGITLIPTKNRIEELRMIKRPEEIENIRAAAKLTDKCFDYILTKIKPGVTESEISWEIEKFIRERGAGLAFSPIVAFGSHTSQPHYQSITDYQLSTNNLILLDFGARVNGYCSDMTRMVFIGKPKDEWVHTYQAVLQAQTVAIEKIQTCYHVPVHGSKISGSQLDQLAKTVIQKEGFPIYPHSLGHGVGLEIHEGFRLSTKKDFKLRPGMVFTIEPGIYLESQFGIRIEDLTLLTKSGLEILSKSTKKMIILNIA